MKSDDGRARSDYRTKRGDEEIAKPNGYGDHDPYLFSAISFRVADSFSERLDICAQRLVGEWGLGEWAADVIGQVRRVHFNSAPGGRVEGMKPHQEPSVYKGRRRRRFNKTGFEMQ